MATQNSNQTLVKGSRSTRSTIALKITMATSGLVFIAFLLVHMYGNLMAFGGENSYNEYAHHLRVFGEPMLPENGLLWILRVVLLVSLVAHVGSAIALTGRAHKARTTKYSVKKNVASSLSSRTMRWGGLAIFVFIVWHLLHFTIAKINPTGGETENPYVLVVDSFNTWWMTVIYLVALFAVGMHLHHGVWSACQTLGFTNTVASRKRAKRFGWVVAIVIAGGFALIPLSVLFEIVK
ncbi:succinate dehydrogenase cytochrome b subunit [Nocardioides yefusunii]|uniref:Succinate dehydrogenase cytochrome b subunit n=1 Tax=Nocardioides yefusunii TaxID=2500546 RepID=A0ABW1QY51_9ACTN|nr:succinate dehydrogenase cytochrome b subunit [Nocardioides yefusunii]